MSSALPLSQGIEVVVIGASAGGVEALSAILPALPAGLRVAVFVVLHLPRERPSLLVEIFRPRCALAVLEAADKEPVQAGTIYFAPPDYHLLLEKDGRMSLSADEPVNFSRPSIDVLFESAADAYGARLLGVLLTGGNEDGAAGLQAIGRAGGATVVQDPARAQVAYMPEAATKLGPVDQVLPLPEIAGLFGGLHAADIHGDR